MMDNTGKIKVLIVDDSAMMRKLLSKMVTSCSDFELVGAVPDAFAARECLVEHRPDVMTLDIEMPKMDGLSFLERVMQFIPTRTLVISSIAAEGSGVALRALELGAIDVVEKPVMDDAKDLEAMSRNLVEKIRMASRAKIQVIAESSSRIPQARPVAAKAPLVLKPTGPILAVASSTGGTEALKVLLGGFPAEIPATVIVQHMPAGFTKTYAQSLNSWLPF